MRSYDDDFGDIDENDDSALAYEMDEDLGEEGDAGDVGDVGDVGDMGVEHRAGDEGGEHRHSDAAFPDWPFPTPRVVPHLELAPPTDPSASSNTSR